MTNTEQALPDYFEFVTGSDIPYKATRKGTRYEIYWEGACFPNGDTPDYSVRDVESHIGCGAWIITSPKREQTKAPETYVTKLISVPANKYTIVENNGKSTMAYTLVETDNQPEDRLLSRIKAFTKVTNSSVFIHDGFYEVYCNGVDAPAKADTDEDLEKLMNAVVTLYEAT